jgi:hypothetical protein
MTSGPKREWWDRREPSTFMRSTQCGARVGMWLFSFGGVSPGGRPSRAVPGIAHKDEISEH